MNKSIDKGENVNENFHEVVKSSLLLEDVTVNECLEIISGLYNEQASEVHAVVTKHCDAVISPALATILVYTT